MGAGLSNLPLSMGTLSCTFSTCTVILRKSLFGAVTWYGRSRPPRRAAGYCNGTTTPVPKILKRPVYGVVREALRGCLWRVGATLRGRRPRAIAAVSVLTNPPKFRMPIANPLPIGNVETDKGSRDSDGPAVGAASGIPQILNFSSFRANAEFWGRRAVDLSHPIDSDQLPTHLVPCSFFDRCGDSAGLLGTSRPKRCSEDVRAATLVDFPRIRYGLPAAL